jgi:hypothetical protein
MRYPSYVVEETKAAMDQFRVGLCADCIYARRIESERAATFYLCERSFSDPTYQKYPRLPVIQCLGYVQKP